MIQEVRFGNISIGLVSNLKDEVTGIMIRVFAKDVPKLEVTVECSGIPIGKIGEGPYDYSHGRESFTGVIYKNIKLSEFLEIDKI